MKRQKINRKKFLKITGITAGAAAVTGSLQLMKDDILSGKKYQHTSFSDINIKMDTKKTPVFISAAQNTTEKALEEAVSNAVERATDFKWLKKGETVFIKPVLNSGNPYPATTSPAALAAVIRLLKRKGAGRVIVGDMSGVEHLKFFKDKTTGSSRKLMEASGMLKAVTEAGGEPYFFEEAGWDSFYPDTTDTKGLWTKSLMMPSILKEADHIVLMPRCSRHILAGSSLGLKAVVGYWRTDTRFEYHYHGETLHERTAEGNRTTTLLKKQRLVVSTGDKLLSTVGPDDGYIQTPGEALVIASESVVAHDMVSLAWLLHNRKTLPEDKQNKFIDHSTGVAKIVNRVVVKMLSSWGKAAASETFFKNDLETIWDDKVLKHACKLSGSIPDINLVNVNDRVSGKTLKKLNAMVHG